MYDALTKDCEVYVRLKAINLFISLAKKPANHNYIKPVIYECCVICLKFSEEFWLESIPGELSKFFDIYEDLIPLAPEMFKQIERVFLELMTSKKDKP